MDDLHPSEMKNLALAAAANAERDGFIATSEAWIKIAKMCSLEASILAALISGSASSSSGDFMDLLAVVFSSV